MAGKLLDMALPCYAYLVRLARDRTVANELSTGKRLFTHGTQFDLLVRKSSQAGTSVSATALDGR